MARGWVGEVRDGTVMMTKKPQQTHLFVLLAYRYSSAQTMVVACPYMRLLKRLGHRHVTQ